MDSNALCHGVGVYKKKKTRVICASLINVLCLMISDLAPVILDDSMRPLEPVLRDNFWLLTHVVIIVSSYGAFFLSFALADVVLFYFLRGEEKYKSEIKEGAQMIYRMIQVGFVLLAWELFSGECGRITPGDVSGAGTLKRLGFYCVNGLLGCFARPVSRVVKRPRGRRGSFT